MNSLFAISLVVVGYAAFLLNLRGLYVLGMFMSLRQMSDYKALEHEHHNYTTRKMYLLKTSLCSIAHSSYILHKTQAQAS